MEGTIQAPFGSIVDDLTDKPGYGPFNVYDRLAKGQAKGQARVTQTAVPIMPSNSFE
jgi:hypothetical protein